MLARMSSPDLIQRNGFGLALFTRVGIKASPSASLGGGLTIKTLALMDALSNPVRFVLLPGHRDNTIVGATDQGNRVRRAGRRQGIRSQLDHRAAERARGKSRHLATPEAQSAARPRSGCLQVLRASTILP